MAGQCTSRSSSIVHRPSSGDGKHRIAEGFELGVGLSRVTMSAVLADGPQVTRAGFTIALGIAATVAGLVALGATSHDWTSGKQASGIVGHVTYARIPNAGEPLPGVSVS